MPGTAISAMRSMIDLDRYPLHDRDTPAWSDLVERCRHSLRASGMFELADFVRPEALAATVNVVAPLMATVSSEQRRSHNIYFLDRIEGLADDHPALTRVETINHTLCADQLGATPLLDLYRWPPLRDFVAATLDVPALHVMDDELASVNVLSYRPGEALNWHFDRSEFTTTILLQPATAGGVFEYRSALRSDDDPNYDGVGRLITGNDPDVSVVDVRPGALNVFRGKNTAHRVTTVQGEVERLVAVLSYYDRPGVRFSDEENRGFYGRSARSEPPAAAHLETPQPQR